MKRKKTKFTLYNRFSLIQEVLFDNVDSVVVDNDEIIVAVSTAGVSFLFFTNSR